ncbi:hypothetical protein Tco_1069067 [Tanacetum coccineum]|uniref:Uncharacterized protein n=1 Tax=Tanacetum coccineum TaxID=301880 RepID=A0ABQ5HHG1_9ASTR
MIQKQIDEAKVRQLAIMNLAVEYDNACTAKDDLRKAYEECNDIPQEKLFILDSDEALMSTQEYMQKVVEDVGEDDDFKSGSWVSVTNYVNANGGTITGCLGDIKNFLKNGKLKQVVAIVKSCSPNVFGDLTVTKISQVQYLEQYITKSLVKVVMKRILL